MTSLDIGLLAQAAQDIAVSNPETAEPTWMSQLQDIGWVCLTMFLPVIAAYFLGRMIARQLRMESHAWRLALIFCCLASGVVVIAHMWPPKLGVDLRGGVNIIGELDQQGEIKAADIVPILRKRIDPSGVREIVIRPRGDYQIEVIIPDVSRLEAERTWKLLAKAGQLLFRIVGDDRFAPHGTALRTARDNTLNRQRIVRGEPTEDEPDGEILARWYSLARIDPESKFARESNGYLYFKFIPLVTHLCRDAKTGQLIDLQEAASAGVLADPDGNGTPFTKWCEAKGIDDVEILMIEPSEKENVEGRHLRQVRFGYDQSMNPAVYFGTDNAGSKRMGRLTTRNKPQDGKYKLLGIVLDGQLDSAPRINSVITDQGIIQGRFSEDEVNNLIATLKSGKLDVTLKDNWISLDQIESTLGNELKQKGFLAIGLSMGLVLIFMVIYYRFSGIVACAALLLNLVFILALILMVKQALTLAGLAGLVLTVGMSVDANVLIFERIREELARGSALRMAIRNGFDRATTTIVDANVTTLITAIILYLIGTETIKSFAVTLILGILMGMFTAIFCSRAVFEIAERKRWITQLSMTRILSGQTMNFLSKRTVAAFVSVAIIAVGLFGVFQRGQGVLDKDLRGGTTARIVLNKDSNASEVSKVLNAASYTIPEQNEQVEFEVTPITNDPRSYIINSNLRAYSQEEVEELEAEPPRLEEILAKEFSGMLAMLSMNYDPNEIKVESLARANEAENNSNGSPIINRGDQGSNQTIPTRDRMRLATISALNPFSILVDPNLFQEEETGNQEEETGNQENDAQETNTSEGDETSAPDSAADGQPGATQEDPGVESTSAPENSSTMAERFLASTVLSFKYPLNAESVKGGLVEAAQQLGDVPLGPKDIEVTPVVAAADTVQGKEWQVELTVSKPDDATRVFNSLKSKMDSTPYIPNTSAVGGQIASQSRWQALIAMVASLLGIIAYVWIRFQNIAFGLAAVVALIHDVLVVLGAIAISSWLSGVPLIDNFKISLPVIAAFLTIIGYSLNDTIVVFDRIREVRGKRTDLTAEMINKSISQTLARTILTSVTTFIVVFILFLLGGDAIHAFAFALVIGVIVGTYSSIFVASPTLLFLMNWGKAKSKDKVVATAKSAV